MKYIDTNNFRLVELIETVEVKIRFSLFIWGIFVASIDILISQIILNNFRTKEYS